jgi:hypothetical protein
MANKKLSEYASNGASPAALDLIPMLFWTGSVYTNKTFTGAHLDTYVRTLAPSVQTVTSSATVTAVSTNDLVDITALAVGVTLANPTGTFANGQILTYRIKDNATAQTIAFGSKFKGYGRALPTTTTISKYIEISAMYNSVADTFSVVYIVEL